ncbi:hypothetical protein [Brytella acorum]|uniref:Uncharacterized protein n=1 Tax=Brytella acorum TaxID=2959299 RepID=A0AA35Y2S6_9PROT|nr:hypothetical protein [Brytella acorum]CAI9121863.1 hypothetical protein LMG32879_002718 [Brytella acorum]
MEKILLNGNKLVISSVELHGAVKYGKRLCIIVAEIDANSHFYRRDGKNVKQLHYEENTVIWWPSNTSPDYRGSLERAKDKYNTIN